MKCKTLIFVIEWFLSIKEFLINKNVIIKKIRKYINKYA